MKIFTPIVEHLHLQIRFNLKTRNVEIKTCKETKDIGALQKAADFVRAFILGFEVEVSVTSLSLCSLECMLATSVVFQDALALVRLDDLYLESFQVTDGEF